MKRRKRARAMLVEPKQTRTSLSPQAHTDIEVAQIRLRRAQDVLSALAFCADEEAELALGPVAVAARDLIDLALDGLATLCQGKKPASRATGQTAMGSVRPGRGGAGCSPPTTNHVCTLRARELFARNVCSLRTARGLSQEGLGFDCDLHRTYIGSIERAERNVGVDNMERIAAALHTKLPELLRSRET
jgi:hypothetical protein